MVAGFKRVTIVGCALALSAAGCNSLPAKPKVSASASGRTGTNVGISAVFFADFAALARAGKLTALAPLLTRAIANGSAGDLINTLQLLQTDGQAAPYAQALGQLLNAEDQAPLSALLAENGPAHVLISDPQAGQAVAALAALNRTSVLRQIGYTAADAMIQSPLVGFLLPDLAETLREGGADGASYLGAALGLQQHDAAGNPEPMGIAAVDLTLALRSEGRLHPLLDPFTTALGDPTLASTLRIVGAVADDLRQNPQDLATWNAILDSLGPVLGSGVLAQQLTPPDAASLSPLRLNVEAQLLGQTLLTPAVVVPGAPAAALQTQVSQIPVNVLDNIAQMLGPDGGLGSQALAALRQSATAGNPVPQLLEIFQPYLTYPYNLGQPVTDGSMAGARVGFMQLSQLVYDGLFAYIDTSALNSFLSGIDSIGGPIGLESSYTLLANTIGCGSIGPATDYSDPANPINALPNYPHSVALELFDDVNSQVDNPGDPPGLSATKRITFLACFNSRQGRLPSFLQSSFFNNPLFSALGAPDLAAGDPNSTNNPTVQYVLDNDQQGLGVLGASFDPDFDLSQPDATALGTHTRFGPLRVLWPVFHALYVNPTANPNDLVYPNVLRYFLTMSLAMVAQSYTGPDGQTHALSCPPPPTPAPPECILDLITPLQPLLQPLISTPTPATSPGSQLFGFFWNTLQPLPVDGTTLGDQLLAVGAAALQRRQDPSAPALFEPMLGALEAHKDDLDRLTRALWPAAGPFALKHAPGSPLAALDTLISGGAGRTGLSSTFAGPTPRATAPAELQFLLATPLDRSLQVMSTLRQADPNSVVYGLNQRLLASGAGRALAASGAATLDVPGLLPLLHLSLQIDVLPQTVDLIELVDQAQLTPGVLSLGDAFVQGGAAPEALDLIQLTLQDTGP